MIHFEIFEQPTSWSAPLTHGHIHYNPKHREKLATMRKIQSVYQEAVLNEYVVLHFTFKFEPPKSASKKERIKMLEGQKFPTKKDVTNLVKFYEDCLKKIIIEDDRLVVKIIANKLYAEKESIDIKIFTLKELSHYAPQERKIQEDDRQEH